MAKLELLCLFGFFALGLAVDDGNVTLKYGEVIDWLRSKSDPDVIPISQDDPKPVENRMEMSLLYIVGVKQDLDLIEIIVRLKQTWLNKVLAWDKFFPELKIENVTLPLRYLWEPDTTATSAITTELLSPEIAVVSPNGVIQLESELRLVLHTNLKDIDSTSGANIKFPFKSWAYDNSQLTLANPLATCFVADEFESRMFLASNTTVTKSIVQSTSTGRYFDVHTFSFNLKRSK